jgi:hypothetical protein
MHLGRQVIEQEGEGLVNWLGFDEVVIVEGEDNPVGEGGNLVN